MMLYTSAFAARWLVWEISLYQNLLKSTLQKLCTRRKKNFVWDREGSSQVSSAWKIMQSLQIRLFVWYWNSFHVWQDRISHLPLKWIDCRPPAVLAVTNCPLILVLKKQNKSVFRLLELKKIIIIKMNNLLVFHCHGSDISYSLVPDVIVSHTILVC